MAESQGVGTASPLSNQTYQTQTNNSNKLLAQIAQKLGAAGLGPAAAASVGSYVMAKCTTAASFGANVAGAALTPSNAAGVTTGASALTGTWQCMGESYGGDVSLFVRVS